jgi:hypothetical protein
MCAPAVLLLAVLQAAAASPADTLAKARAEAKSLEFGAALSMAHEALEAGGADPKLTAQIHAFTGEMAAALGDRDLAKSEFARALELDPNLLLDASASPRIREPFEDARSHGGQRALTVQVTSARDANGKITSDVTTAGDVLSMVAGFELEFESNGRFSPVKWPSTSPRREWECQGPCRYFVVALDKFGNQLASAGDRAAPLTPVSLVPQVAEVLPPAEAVSAAPASPWYTHAGPYLAAGAVVLAALAVFFGAQFDSEQRQLTTVVAQRSSHLMSEATSLDSSRQRDHTLLFVTSIAAVLAAGGAVFTW